MSTNKIQSIFIVGLLGISALTNIFLARQVISMKEKYTASSTSTQVRPVVGEFVPPIEVITMKGDKHLISYEEINLPTVLYIFSPNCGFCKDNAENISKLHEQAKSRYRFVGISIEADNLDEILVNYGVTFPVYKQPSKNSLRVYKFSSTPQTIVISTEGKVIKNWIGEYFYSNTRKDIENFLNVKL
jgi:peroxiredoxin